MSKQNKVCIIGPTPSTRYIGGVATHIKNLKTLPCLAGATVLDIGSLKSNKASNIFAIFNNLIKLRQTLVVENFNHILINTSIYSTAFLKLLLILIFIPNKNQHLHVFFHGGRFPELHFLISKITALIFWLILRKVNVFHFLSPAQLNGFKRLFIHANAIIYSNYSTTNEILKKPDNHSSSSLKLLFVGRLVKEKGIFDLVDAVTILRSQHKNIELTIVGDGPEYQSLIEITNKCPTNNIRFTGYLSGDTLQKAYQDSHILILPTYHPEGFPYVAIEAMRAGLPIIATESGALETLVINGVTGFKVKAQDVESIVLAVNKFIDNPSLVNNISNNCYNFFTEHLSSTSANKYYSELLS